MILKLKIRILPTQKPYFDNQLDFNKIVVSSKVSFSEKDFKYFIGYKDAKKIRPLCTFITKMSAYRRNFDETKYMSF